MSEDLVHGSFDDILALADDSLRPLCIRLRALIVSVHKAPCEIVWPKHRIVSFGIGPKKMTEHYAYIGVQKHHLNLGFYHGATLSDPHSLLEGTGQRLRHIKLSRLDPQALNALTALLKAAVEDRLEARSKLRSP